MAVNDDNTDDRYYDTRTNFDQVYSSYITFIFISSDLFLLFYYFFSPTRSHHYHFTVPTRIHAHQPSHRLKPETQLYLLYA